jgi:ABC-type glycerol-3-phosphate transport system permease component
MSRALSRRAFLGAAGAAALAGCATSPPTSVFLVFQRTFVQGIASTGLK